MPADRPLLTIAVPTFNRSRYLTRLLTALAPQLAGETKVELIVSDNASPDETPELVRRFQAQGLELRYIRNQENIGGDRNLLQCFEAAAGKYVWIFGDDDVIGPGSVARILAALSGPEYDMVYVSGYPFFDKEKYDGHRAFRPKPDLLIHSAQELAAHVHVYFTFISGNIINKDRVSSVPHRPFSTLVATNLVQLGWTYTALNHHRRSLLIRDPLIASLANNSGSYGLFSVFGTSLSEITRTWVENGRVRSIILNGTLRSFFPWFIFSYRFSKGTFSSEDPRRILGSLFGRNFRYWIFDYPLIVMPMRIAAAWLLGIRVLNRLDRSLGFPLVRRG